MQKSLKAESLYLSTQEGRWEEVVAEYKRNAWIHTRPINITYDTALHVAVNDNRADVVKKLVEELKRSKKSLRALELGNVNGDTPLHCAASRGSPVMCQCIAEAQGGGDYKLIEARNRNQETPLYLAALHGHKDAFLYLYSRCADKTVGPCRRGIDGDTVLHCTIRRDYFELAYEIIHLYKDQIVGSMDEKGTTPLHILANQTSGFEISSNFRWYNKLLYGCIMVEPFMIWEQSSENKGYRTRSETDTEDPGYDDGYENVRPNYRTCNILVRALLSCFIWLVIRAFGLKDVRKKKEKHVWCGRILEALWRHKNTAYVGGGSAPQGRPILYASDDDDNQEEEEDFSNDQQEEEEEEEEFPNPFNVIHHKTGDDDTNIQGKPYVMGNQNIQEVWNTAVEMNERQTRIVPVDQSKQKGGEEEKNSGAYIRESALLIAARNGVLEIVTKILRDEPGTIHEINSQGQSLLHVAVEHRRLSIIEILKDKFSAGLIHSVDNDGNSILHVVAESAKFQTQSTSALEMQDEIKWYEYVKSLVPSYVTSLPNYRGETPEYIFLRDHKDLVQKSDEWLCRTSESCSVVAALVAGVAFATSSTVPGGNDDKTGKPTLEGQPGFDLFAISALIALCFSVTALILFLSILTSRKHAADFMKKLPVKLFLALSSLFVSICSMFISFCAAHSFVLEGKPMKSVPLLYAIIGLPVTFTIVEFPLYMDLFRGIFMKVQPPYNLKRI